MGDWVYQELCPPRTVELNLLEIRVVANPLHYLNYERLAVLYIYRKFIRGWFADHAQIMVLTIAAGQLGIALGMAFKGRFLKLAIVGQSCFC